MNYSLQQLTNSFFSSTDLTSFLTISIFGIGGRGEAAEVG